MYPSRVELKLLVSRRKEVGFFIRDSTLPDGGFGVLGEAFSMAAAYAFDRVLKAVGEVRSISPFNAVVDFPSMIADGPVLI